MEPERRRIVASKKAGGLFDLLKYDGTTWVRIEEGLDAKTALRRLDMKTRFHPTAKPRRQGKVST